MKEAGWIPAHRKLFDPEHPLAPNKRRPASHIHAWLDLCQMAQHKDGFYQKGERLDQGQVVASYSFLADRWCWSRSTVHRFFKRLESATMVATLRETQIGTVYSIVNYDTYAVVREVSRNSERDTSGTPAEPEQPYNHLTTTTGGAKKTKRKHQIPDGWRPTDAHREKAAGLRVNCDIEAEKFADHHAANGNKFVSWDRAFSNWLRKAAEFQKRDAPEPQRKIRLIGGTRFYR